ncbi:lysophospholipase [Desulfosarcina alkanivorans]|uniref:Lysophospholipase n=1 Tax=Desulfosarcina alkanivorans TaxID=571177 RepID=A0A5K7YVD2_9BACT|nr:alpha/beta hydrolase [Desulfosarcina alkanivorans]BBO72280.1 lysophospholipase [Desulfosarcina alkanivorans]
MADIKEKSARIEGIDGTMLFYRNFPAQKERFRVVVSHGLGEHSGRYTHVVDALCPMGASLWIHDHRGHGRSQGKRGHVNAFNDYVGDLKVMVELAGRQRPETVPLLLLGHSMGGLIALSFARQHPRHLDGLILSSPLLGVPQPPPAALAAIARFMSMLWPTLSLNNKLDPSRISHDRAVVKAYVSDEWVHSRISARWFTRCMSEIRLTGGSPEAIRQPTLMQVGGDDHLVSAPAALAFFEGLTVADKTLCHYERLFHEIYNETPADRKKVLEDLKQWVADRYL